MTAFSEILWFVILFPVALACIIGFVVVNAPRHITDPVEQKNMVERFRESGG